MNQKNILNEGLIDKILDYIKTRKVKKLDKIFREKPEIKDRIRKLEKDIKDAEKWLISQGVTPRHLRK